MKTVLSSITNGSLTNQSRNETIEIPVLQDAMDIDSRGRSHHRSSPSRRSSHSSLTSCSLTDESIHEAPEIVQDNVSSSPGRSRSSSRSTSESRKHMKSAPFFNDVVPSGRPAIKDYSPDVRHCLLNAVYLYENWVLSKDGFPDTDMQYKWARNAWDITSGSMDASAQYKLSERMIQLVSLLFSIIHLRIC